MKCKTMPTQQQMRFNSNERIISKTDLSGRLSDVNRLCMQVCNDVDIHAGSVLRTVRLFV
ncbi:hypothetical protein [Craterilacuibacter sp.]|uniref:hypothetical protein n=1 Tax=Craterilacuibacter sp. TaxID=2870909 RepID=UPI003F3FDD2F